jgi:prevent-host-death family protein
MNTTNIPALDARHRLGELLERVYYQSKQYRIVRKNKAMARLVSESMMDAIDQIIESDPGFADTLALMLNKEAKASIAMSRQEIAEGKKVPIEQVLK